LFALADEDLVVGIRYLGFGFSHCIASSRAYPGLQSRVSVAGSHHHTASCRPIETVPTLLPRGFEFPGLLKMRPTGFV
ncbi:MAG: hypothetical protein Q7J60_17025, partial [Bradyrhizobium sp.]|nr:hypothetical protein [Bradyrhizobium sp.]